jgi:hypothetical protein
MKKFIPLVVVGLLVLCGLQAVALPFNMAGTSVQKWRQTPYAPLNRDDILDQSQPGMNRVGPIGQSDGLNYIWAQSFKPTLNMLTRVELMIGIQSSTYDLTVGIRDDLNGSDLTSISRPASDFGNLTWEEFDFPDIMVTPGNTYYIVSSTVNATGNSYKFGYQMYSSYLNGTLYQTINEGTTWTPHQGGINDMAFNTYGIDTTATNLSLTITGGIGVTINTKNVGDFDATNVKTHATITGGILGRINISKDVESATLTIGDVLPFKTQPLGLGPITIITTTRADNAAQITKTAEGFILLFFVIIK